MRRSGTRELHQQVERLTEANAALAARVEALEDAVREDRTLNVRLADVVDVVTELLVPAAHRRDAVVTKALRRLQASRVPDPTDAADDDGADGPGPGS